MHGLYPCEQGNALQVHGILMVVGFGILIPLGVLVARTMKPLDPLWFHLHRTIQVGTVSMVHYAHHGIPTRHQLHWLAGAKLQ